MGQLFGHDIDLLCLDLDDTILDTEVGAHLRFEAATAAIRSIRPDIREDTIQSAVACALRTHPSDGRVVNFLADTGLAPGFEVDTVRTAYFERMPTSIVPLESAFDVLVQLRGRFRTALVTNGPSALQRAKIAHFDLEPLVDWVVISGEVGVAKPDRAIFEQASRLAGIDLAHTAHVGDSLATDVAGALAAGALSIWVANDLLPPPLIAEPARPHYTIRHIRELLEAATQRRNDDRRRARNGPP